MAAREQGKGGLQPRAELAPDLGWQTPAGRGVTARAIQAMELILDNIGPDDRQFGYLMTQRGRVGPAERPAAAATGYGLAGDCLPNLISGNQQALSAGMAGLPAAVLPGLVSSLGWPTFAVKAVRRGG